MFVCRRFVGHAPIIRIARIANLAPVRRRGRAVHADKPTMAAAHELSRRPFWQPDVTVATVVLATDAFCGRGARPRTRWCSTSRPATSIRTKALQHAAVRETLRGNRLGRAPDRLRRRVAVEGAERRRQRRAPLPALRVRRRAGPPRSAARARRRHRARALDDAGRTAGRSARHRSPLVWQASTTASPAIAIRSTIWLQAASA